MNNKFDLIGIGECLIELFEEAPNSYRQSVAGDVFNTLFYASRLGLKTGFISNFGSDDLTKHIGELMDREGIDRSCTSISEKKTNGLYLISTNESGDPHYAFWRNDSAAKETLQSIDLTRMEEYILSSTYFHFSAIALAILNEREILISLLKKIHGQVTITFDTNFRKGLWNDVGMLKTFIESSSSFVDILFVSSTDDENIFGRRSPEEAIIYYKELGYKKMIFKQGSSDVLAWDGREMISVPVFKNIAVVDATAAGDAFNAGFISAQLRGESFENSIRTGNGCAAFVITRHGGIAEDFQK
ncbi:MAG: sugar kinase [Candidatus Kapaibacterium sp.]